jgi:hypothetical protein
MKSLASLAMGFIVGFSLTASGVAQEREKDEHSYAGPEAGTGRAHMDTSCSPAVAPMFDRALALLHNFWYSRALESFQQVSSADPECAMAYWGAAITYNHPFWDAPSLRTNRLLGVLCKRHIPQRKCRRARGSI